MGTSLVVQWIGIQLAGDGGSIPVQGTKIPRATEQLRLCAIANEACAL